LAKSLKGRLEIPERGARRRGLERVREPIFKVAVFSTIKKNLTLPVDRDQPGGINLGADPNIFAQTQAF
jgi:hypothetical protein